MAGAIVNRPDRNVYNQDFCTVSDPDLWHKIRRDPIIVCAFDLLLANIATGAED